MTDEQHHKAGKAGSGQDDGLEVAEAPDPGRGDGPIAEESGGDGPGPPETAAEAVSEARKRSFWEEARVPIVAAIVGALALTVAPPVRNWCAGVADYAKDMAVGLVDYDEHLVDNVKERVDHRPGWASGPTFLDGSVDYLNAHIDVTAPVLNELQEGLKPTVVSVDDMVERGVDFNGVPVVLVARVLSRAALSSDMYGDLPTHELTVRGADPRHILTLGAGGRVGNDVFAEPGEIVIVQGVLIATGRIDDPYSEEEIESGYFTVLSVPGVGFRNPLVRRAVRELEEETDG